MYHKKMYVRAAASLLEISQHILGQWVIEIIGHDERARSEAEGSWTPHAFDRTNFCDRPVVLGDDERFALNCAVQEPFGITLHFFYADVHDVAKSSKGHPFTCAMLG